MKRKILEVALLLLCAFPAFGAEYFLEIERSCSTSGEKFEFECKKGDGRKLSVFSQQGRWYGRNPDSDELWKLTVLKNDQYILALDTPVYFSGKSIIYIMKPTRRFYWSEFAYSDYLKEHEGTVRYGRILSVKN